MKYLITGDWHLDEKKPKNRTESYVKEQEDKVKWILQLAKDEKVEAILQPGDFCNTSKLSDRFKTRWIDILKYNNIPIFTVPGQHDMRYHSSDIENTPMGVLGAARVINILYKYVSELREVVLYGAGWNENIPGIGTGFPEMPVNILLIHKMVSEKALWPGHEFTTPQWLFDNTDFDLIVCGDNHKSFIVTVDGSRYIVNCGSLMRSAIDQADHKPVVYIYDTETKRLLQSYIPVRLFKNVMNIEEATKDKERNKELEDFVEGLSDTNIEGLDFKKNLIDHLEKNKDKIADGVIKIIDEVVG